MRIILTIFCITTLIGCATRSLDVDIDSPGMVPMMTPETEGSLGSFSFNAFVSTSRDIELGGTNQNENIFTNDVGNVTIDSTSVIQDGLSGGIRGEAGIGKYINLMAGKYMQGTFDVGAKLCLFVNCDASKNGFKLSLFGFVGSESEDENSNDYWFSDQDNKEEYDNVTAFVEQQAWSSGLTMGYRFDEFKLLYLSGSYIANEIESQISISDGREFNLGGNYWSYGVALGFKSSGRSRSNGSRSFLQIEAGHTWEKLKALNTSTDHEWFVALGFGSDFSFKN